MVARTARAVPEGGSGEPVLDAAAVSRGTGAGLSGALSLVWPPSPPQPADRRPEPLGDGEGPGAQGGARGLPTTRWRACAHRHPRLPRDAARVGTNPAHAGPPGRPRPGGPRLGPPAAGRGHRPIEPLFPPKRRRGRPTPSRKGRRRPRHHASRPPTADKLDIADFAKVELRVGRYSRRRRWPDPLKPAAGGPRRGAATGGGHHDATPRSRFRGKWWPWRRTEAGEALGVESNGMVLAASIDGKAVLCTSTARSRRDEDK